MSLAHTDIRRITALPNDFFDKELRSYRIHREQIEAIEQEQSALRVRLSELPENLVKIQSLNEDSQLVDRLERTVNEKISLCIKEIRIEKNVETKREQLHSLVEKHPKNIFLSDIHTKYLQEYFVLSRRRSKDQDHNEDEQLKEDYITIIADFLKERAETLYSVMHQIRLAQHYYKTIMLTYLEKKMIQNLRIKEGEANAHQELQTVINSLTPDLLAAKNKETCRGILDQIQRKRDQQHGHYFLENKQVAEVLELFEKIYHPYKSFSDFQKAVEELRKKHCVHRRFGASHEDTLYSLMPDTNEKANDPFPEIKTASQKTRLTIDYQRYQAQHREITPTRSYIEDVTRVLDNDIKEALRTAMSASQDDREEIMKPIISEKLCDRPHFKLEKTECETIMSIVSILSTNAEIDKEAQGLLADIKKEQTVIGLLVRLSPSDHEEEQKQLLPPPRTRFQAHIDAMVSKLDISPELKAISVSKEKRTQYEKDITLLKYLRGTLDANETSLESKREQLSKNIDQPLIDLLRAQVLHAATLFFYPPMKVGLMHGWHHFGEDSKIYILIAQIFNPQIKNFAEVSELIKSFLAQRNKEGKELHTNSFDTLLLATLFNEGSPKGIFKLDTPIRNISTAMVQNYPQFVRHAQKVEDITTQNKKTKVAELKSSLRAFYVKRYETAGEVLTMVRGATRIPNRNMLREEAIANLNTMTAKIQECKTNSPQGTPAPGQASSAAAATSSSSSQNTL